MSVFNFQQKAHSDTEWLNHTLCALLWNEGGVLKAKVTSRRFQCYLGSLQWVRDAPGRTFLDRAEILSGNSITTEVQIMNR